ncbi:MAG: stringent starvation protein A [Gammaproteobacteria bacterium]|nr:stringent starvation protein A [Gammaproteobacteria bacterium]
MTSSLSKRNTMVLYGLENDIHSHRVRIVLAEKSVAYDTVNIKMSAPPLELIEVNPSLSLPTLVDRELVLYGSEIIMEYLDERLPYPPLMPIYPVAKARCRLMMHRINEDWYTLIPKIEQKDQAAKKELIDSLISISSMLEEPPYFMTDEFTLVDCCVIPLFLRLKHWGCAIPKHATGLWDYIKKVMKKESVMQSLTATEKVWLTELLQSGD